MKIRDVLVYTLILLWVILPDPTDIFDFGLPLIEGFTAGIYYIFTKRFGNGGKIKR